MSKDNYFQKEKKSFGHAFKGVAIFFKETNHAKVHLIASILVLIFGVLLKVTVIEWLSLILSMAIVWVSEAINSALEYAVDLASPNYHDLAKKAKDVAAGAVLIASGFAVIIALLVFIPKLFQL
ncbi:MAG: diacylglycerol kinase family protein [Bacteroidia bacterium]